MMKKKIFYEKYVLQARFLMKKCATGKTRFRSV